MSSPSDDRLRTPRSTPSPIRRHPTGRATGPRRTPFVAGTIAVAAVASALSLLPAAPATASTANADIALVAALEGAPPPPARKPTLETAARLAAGARVPPVASALITPKPLPPGARRAAEAAADGPADIDALTDTPADRHPALAGGEAADPLADPVSTTAALPRAAVAVEARIDSGDTLIGLLIEAGVDRIEAHKAINALEQVFDPRRMRPGHVVNIRFAEPEDDTLAFQGFDFEPSTGTRVVVLPDGSTDDGFTAEEKKARLVRDVVRFGGPITLSLYQAAVDAGVSEQALAEMIRILSYDIDFQRDIQKDDTFEVMYERFSTVDGRHVRDGRILFTALTNGGERITAYPFETADGHLDYFDDQGRGIRKPLMRTPIDGARISSSFGMRRHPILGYSKMHTGVDFAAPTGTPIYAAGDGVVRVAGRRGGYGNYVQIRHTGEFSTAYAHMSRILVRNGQRVRQGEIIGRVGSTGRSTGPHLHYEIIRNGKKVNPMGIRFQPAIRLAGAELERFQAERADLDRLYASLRTPTEIASTAGGSR